MKTNNLKDTDLQFFSKMASKKKKEEKKYLASTKSLQVERPYLVLDDE